jgi:CSLREA domain-containing protein
VAHVSTITVNTLIDESDSSCADGNCSLRDAVAAAQPGDSINFSVSGTIVLTHGEISVYKDNLMIKGPGPDRLAISGNNTSRVFVVALADVTISDLSIINGFSTSRGGGIYGYLAGSLTLVNCNVSGNRAEFGGGIYSEAIGLEIRGCSIRDNHAALGGGVDNSSGLQVSGSVFSNNTATSSGGGIYLWEGAASIVDSAFTGNEAAVDGGGIYSPLSQLEVVNTTFSMNSAGGFGGGISASGDIYSNGYLTVTNSVFSENSALFGGGIDVLRLKNASAINSTFSRNTASSGGGVYNRGKLSVTGSSSLSIMI